MDGENKYALHVRSLPRPCSLSYDWIAENLYIADCLAKRITLINVATGKQKNIISDGIQNVKCVVVDPVVGYI